MDRAIQDLATMYNALREIEILLLTTPLTYREKRIYSIACEAINLVHEEEEKFTFWGIPRKMQTIKAKLRIGGKGKPRFRVDNA